MLNAQFSSVFTEEDTENLPQLNKQYPGLSTLSVSAIGVEKLLLNLNASKAAGPDKLSGKLLKATAHEIAPVLQVIFRRSIDKGTLPQTWKEATISPVYKKECRSNPANYCPVSITSILCKILEHIINRHILDHLDEHRILVDAQYGFRKRRSCETQLILTCHDLAKVVTIAAKWTCLSWILLKLLTPLPTSDSSGSWKAMASMATCTDGYSRFLKEEPKE